MILPRCLAAGRTQRPFWTCYVDPASVRLAQSPRPTLGAPEVISVDQEKIAEPGSVQPQPRIAAAVDVEVAQGHEVVAPRVGGPTGKPSGDGRRPTCTSCVRCAPRVASRGRVARLGVAISLATNLPHEFPI
jgi:hypothetical protein